VPTADGDGFVAVADGRLWLIDAGGAPARAVDSGLGRRIDSLLWSNGAVAVVSAEGSLYTADLRTSVFRKLDRPAEDAEFKTFSPQKGLAVFSRDTREGAHLWISGRKVASINGFLAEVAEGQLKGIEYRALTGESLNGWVLLPAAYEPGKRYPTVVWVYGGLTYTKVPPPFYVRLGSSGPFNLQLLSSRGYAVILPSMPLQPEGRPSDPLREMTRGVLPALDKAIELGIADPERLAVMGHSYGGYSVNSLVTQTARFQAAVAISGFCNLASLYGTLDSRFRYDPDARDRLLHMVFAESGQFRLGAPPWKDMDRYVRNSPLTYADQVTTPVMILQGDMDYVPIQQGEEFFTALYRQGKPASFVRYWGEGHIFESPANVADMWARIFAWLARYL
jgi:dipeptidyl aminopeptidase/acylaminoacyl peptidase